MLMSAGQSLQKWPEKQACAKVISARCAMAEDSYCDNILRIGLRHSLNPGDSSLLGLQRELVKMEGSSEVAAATSCCSARVAAGNSAPHVHSKKDAQQPQSNTRRIMQILTEIHTPC
jgi:hypothetical protein